MAEVITTISTAIGIVIALVAIFQPQINAQRRDITDIKADIGEIKGTLADYQSTKDTVRSHAEQIAALKERAKYVAATEGATASPSTPLPTSSARRQPSNA